MVLSYDDVSVLVITNELNSEVVIYCSCPNEASAAQLTKKLTERRYTKMRPLTGGIDTWVAAGFSLDN